MPRHWLAVRNTQVQSAGADCHICGAGAVLGLESGTDQISGVGKLIGMPVSHEWIYRHVAADKARGGKLYKMLRQGHKRYRRGINRKRSVIPDPRSIDERPSIVDTRDRFGDWVEDTVLGKQVW